MSFNVGDIVVCASDNTQAFEVTGLDCYTISGAVQVTASDGPLFDGDDKILYIPHRPDYHTMKDGHPKNCKDCCLTTPP